MTLPETSAKTRLHGASKIVQLDYGNLSAKIIRYLLTCSRAAAESRGAYVGLIGSVQHIKTLSAAFAVVLAALIACKFCAL